MKRTLVIGASENTERYSNKAVRSLLAHNIPVLALGIKAGKIEGVEIKTGFPNFENIDTVSLYVGPKNQHVYSDYILSLKPKRIIFNPGAENPELEKKAGEKGIETLNACTLVMLSVGNF
ncbi:MAG TPA: CoA-binding protein [Bacteroidia bacterium]